MERPRIVVCGLGGNLAFGLPESVWNDGAWVGGGERDLYELAFAAACLGYEVELRGSVSKPVYDQLVASCPGRPSVGDALRSPRPEEIVVVPEGWPEAERYLAAMAWPNRLVMLVMAPLGLFGWAFDGSARIPDPLTVEPSDLHRPEQIRMVDALGFELWSNAERLASRRTSTSS